MDDRSALMAAIIANPDEDTPRLALADWLDEHGDKRDRARAELIRCQIATNRGAPGAKEARRRASAIHRAQYKHWLGPLLNQQVYIGPPSFFRGILEDWCVTPGNFLKPTHQAAVCERFPLLGVDRLVLFETTKRVELLAQSPALAWVSHLRWNDARLEDNGFVALAKSPHLSRLSRLTIDKPWCSDAGLKALANSTGFPNLRALELRDGLWRGAFTAAGVRFLLDTPNFPRLDELHLSGAHTHAVTHRTFFTYKGLSRLRVLGFGFDTDVKALAKCPHLKNLEKLHVSDSTVTDADARQLAANPALAGLKKLELTDMNASRPPLSAVAEQALRDRFGDRLTLNYSILCRES